MKYPTYREYNPTGVATTESEPNDLRLHRLQIQQDMVDAGRLLQKILTV